MLVFKSLRPSCALALLLAACGAPKTRQSPRRGRRGRAGAAAGADAGQAYRIDAAQSELRVLVYRAGPLARFGHNHVMVNRAISGWVDADGPPGGSASSR